MAGSSSFLVFNQNLLNAQDDTSYLADTSRVNGLSAGIASIFLHNKLFRQVSIMVAALGQFIADQGNVASDEDLASLVSSISSSFVATGIDNKSRQQTKALIFGADTRTIAVSRTSGLVTNVYIRDPLDNTLVQGITINRTGGQITSIVSDLGEKTITHTINRTNGLISSITKAVV